MQPVYLICGVSGSGKSWICRQLTEKFEYIPHDEHFTNHARVIIETALIAKRPVITESPFGERVLREQIEKRGIPVIPYFVIEAPEVVRIRYYARERKALPKAAETRATTIRNRAREWNAPAGKSAEVLEMLKELKLGSSE